MNLTNNDKRVLRAVGEACQKFDGFGPHGSGDHIALRRLIPRGLVELTGHGVCEDCDTPKHRYEPTEGPIYRLTDQGRSVVAELCG